MVAYSPELTLREGRELYFRNAGFDAASYTDLWVHLKAGPFRFAFPNTAARVRAVKLHDLHHVLTEYDTTWTGESEIAAWELASGCARHCAAWVLDVQAMTIGLFIAPRRTLRAFVRGRHTGNLYRTAFSESLLDRRLGDVRRELNIAVGRFAGRAANAILPP